MNCQRWDRPSGESYKTIRGKTVTFRRGVNMFMGEYTYPWNAFCDGINIAPNCKTKAECEKEARDYLRRYSKEGSSC